jgi:hypothetical protein
MTNLIGGILPFWGDDDRFVGTNGDSDATQLRANRRRPMKRAGLAVLAAVGCCLAWGSAQAVQAEQFRYQYVPLDPTVPDGFLFFDPVKITNDERVYGNTSACDLDGCVTSVAVYSNGTTTILHEGIAFDANERGTVGGFVILDPEQFTVQAALFTASEVTLIPPLPNELQSAVFGLTDSGIALVWSVDATTFDQTYYLYEAGNVTPLDFGSGYAPRGINNRGLIAGTVFGPFGPGPNGTFRAFRFTPASGVTLLEPVPPDPHSWGLGIRSNGDVLGYSFVSGALERIGFWRGSVFHTWFVEGTPEFPTVSNSLLWNEQGLIVITLTTDLNSYLVPRPGVRINLADLTEDLPRWTWIWGLNDTGDMIGFGGSSSFNIEESFLLRRVSPGSVATVASASDEAREAARERRHAAHGLLPTPMEASILRGPGRGLRKDRHQ